MKKTIFSAFVCFTIGVGSLSAQSLQDGLRAIEFDKFESAKVIFKNLIAQNPANPEYHYYLGQVYTATYNNDSAVIAYNNGVATAPGSGLNRAGLGELKILDEKPVEAEALFAQAMTFNKGKDILTIRAIARGYLAANEKYTDKALEYANKAMELDKKDLENYILLGDVYLEKLDGGKAATNYERGMEVNPKDPKPYVKVANIWLRLKNVEATLEALNKAIELDPNYAPAHKTFSKLYYMAKQFEKAKISYNKYLDLSERSSANQRQFVNILFLGGLHKEALEIIDDIQKTDKTDIYLYRLRAYSIYEVGVAEKIDSADFYNDGVSSIETFLVKIAPDKVIPSDYTYKGKLLSKTGKDSLAIITMLQSLQVDSTDVEVYNEIAKIKNKMRKYDEAASYFQLYIDKKQKPTVVDYYYVARAYYYSRQFGKADTAYIKLLELRPDYAEAYFSRGNTNASMDPDYKDTVAKSMFEKYIEMAGDDPAKNKKNLVDAYTYLGVYAVKKDENEQAKSHFKKVLELDPTNKTATDILKQLNSPRN